MSDRIPSTGQVRIRVLQVNTLTQGDIVHDIKARVLPRVDGEKPVNLRVRDEHCPRPPRTGDRLRLTMQVGQVAGVELLKPKRGAAAGDEADAAAD